MEEVVSQLKTTIVKLKEQISLKEVQIQKQQGQIAEVHDLVQKFDDARNILEVKCIQNETEMGSLRRTLSIVKEEHVKVTEKFKKELESKDSRIRELEHKLQECDKNIIEIPPPERINPVLREISLEIVDKKEDTNNKLAAILGPDAREEDQEISVAEVDTQVLTESNLAMDMKVKMIMYDKLQDMEKVQEENMFLKNDVSQLKQSTQQFSKELADKDSSITKLKVTIVSLNQQLAIQKELIKQINDLNEF